jgi:hypothetical protein
MAVKNITGFAVAGKESGAAGLFTTIWDDGGSCFFEADWYSVYKAAEKSWNLQPEADNSFDTRYCITAYGDEQSNYTKALHQLLQLRKLPLTWNMNDQVWNGAPLPREGRSILLCNADIDSAEAILERASKYLPESEFRNKMDWTALKLAMGQYFMIMKWRRGIAGYSEGMAKLKKSTGAERSRLLKELLTEDRIRGQQSLNASVRETYIQLWRSENQSYWLDIALRPFDEMEKATAYLQEEIRSLQKRSAAGLPVPDGSASRLKVYAATDRYFQNWLFCGPFQGNGGRPPSFLYFPEHNDSIMPKPGDQFSFQEKSYRWKKFSSPAGGISYLQDQWPEGIGNRDWVYAFAIIHSDSTRNMTAFLLAGNGAVIFCNGRSLPLKRGSNGLPMLSGPEFRIGLPLIKGINYLVIKLPGSLPDKAFAFRLQPSVTLVNHKHKYYLNPNTSDHDAE